jgi:hypothetical protein
LARKVNIVKIRNIYTEVIVNSLTIFLLVVDVFHPHFARTEFFQYSYNYSHYASVSGVVYSLPKYTYYDNRRSHMTLEPLLCKLMILTPLKMIKLLLTEISSGTKIVELKHLTKY